MFDISWVLDFIKNIPDFLLYVVPGYLFLFTYGYILSRDKDNSSQTSYLLLNSLISSFVLKTLYDVLLEGILKWQWESSSYRYLLCIFLFSIFCGYVIAQVFVRKNTIRILKKLGIRRTPNDNIWQDIMKPDIWVRIWLKNSDKSYYGQIKLIEDFQREPLIVLEYYQILDGNSNVLADYTSDKKRNVLLNLSKFERIEIVER